MIFFNLCKFLCLMIKAVKCVIQMSVQNSRNVLHKRKYVQNKKTHLEHLNFLSQ